MELLRCFLFTQIQRIIYPPENEGDASISGSIEKNSIQGTIWSTCFISQDSCQPSKGHNPVLAILLNRYGNCVYVIGEYSLIFHCYVALG